MTIELGMVLGLLAVAILMFAINKPRMDAVGLIMLTALPFTGVITMGQSLAGFSDSNIVLIAALFVIGDGLVRTGVARNLGDWLNKTAGSSETKLLVLLMLVVCGLGSMMSSTAVTAIFIPVALRIAQSTGSSPSKLMMPLSMAALISGMTTLVATAPNLVVNSELVRHFQGDASKGFQFFSFTPFGVPILILGVIYMIFARQLLPDRTSTVKTGDPKRPSLADWIEEYQLAKREYRLRVTDQSPLAGKSLKELNLRHSSGANILAVERSGRSTRKVMHATAQTELHAGDVLLIDLYQQNSSIENLVQNFALEPMPLTGEYFNDHSQEIGMAEVMLPGNSQLIGSTIVKSKFRDQYGLTVIGLRRGAKAIGGSPVNEELKIGDTLLVIGKWKAITHPQSQEKDFVVLNLPTELAEVLPVKGKAPHAVACLALVVGLMISGWIPNVQAALIGCLLMGFLGVVDLNSAYRSIDWKTIVLIVGMLPFSIALQNTGGVYLMADGLMHAVGGAGIHVVLGALFVITALLGLFINNTATAV
ncbi:MAG TPA: SLC13 family permease, partial [Gemmatales bacterium]|nr:SLC13 family permease [Gemmatales bacterium]